MSEGVATWYGLGHNLRVLRKLENEPLPTGRVSKDVALAKVTWPSKPPIASAYRRVLALEIPKEVAIRKSSRQWAV